MSAAAGIGLLLTFIGLRNVGLIAADPGTLVRAGAVDHRTVFLLLGLAVAVVLMRRKNPMAFLSSILLVTLLAWGLGYAQAPTSLVSAPDFSSVFLKLDPISALQLALLPAIVSILFTDLFDSLSTFIGVATAAGLTDPAGRPINLRPGVDRRRVGHPRSGPGGHVVRHGIRRKHRRHSDGRTDWTGGRCHGVVLRPVLLHRSAGGGSARLRHRTGAHSRRCGDVPDGPGD